MSARLIPLRRLVAGYALPRCGSVVPSKALLRPSHPMLPTQATSRPFTSSVCRLQQQEAAKSTPIGQVEPKLSLTFTCAVPDCGHRSSHEFTRRSYEKGIVIIQCPGCKNRHLIADHLSWFTETDSDPKTIEEIIKAKGGKVQRGVNYVDGEGYETTEIFKEDTDDTNANKS